MLNVRALGFSGCDAIVIGASAGAVDALGVLLPVIPARAPVPVVVVVHLTPNRPSLLPDLFRPRCLAAVREPEDKQPVLSEAIWFAPPDYHLLIEPNRSFSLSVDEPVRFSRPSIDVLFESAADVYGARLCAIVLTGANEDGAEGARAIRARGGFVVAQDPESAEVKEMPLATIARAEPQCVAALPDIAEFLATATGLTR